MGEVESVLTRKRFALSRDHLGASPLHLAVLHGHTDVVKYIIDNFPEALDGPDNVSKLKIYLLCVWFFFKAVVEFNFLGCLIEMLLNYYEFC